MRTLFLLWWLLWASMAQAQPTTVDLESISPVPTGEWDFEGGKFHLPETTVTSLPAASVSGRIYIVTDTHGTLCASSGGGTTRLICRDTGAAWEAIGSGGGGGGTECASAPCNLNASTTLNSKGICLADGTNCPGITTPTPTLSATPTVTVTATRTATPTPTTTATLTPILCPTNGNAGGLYGAHPEVCQVTPTPTTTPTPTLSATPTVTATATVSATPTPVACSAGTYDAVVGPDVGATCVPGSTPDGAGPTVGAGTPQPIATSTAMPGTSSNFARMDHVHVIPNGSIGLTDKVTGTLPVANGGTNLTAATDDNVMVGNGTTWQSKALPSSCSAANKALNYDTATNAFSCITTNTITASFALYVDKSGTDSASCGPINAPCKTVNGALAIIRAANDNGFATCSLDTAYGCGRCSATTSTQCNEEDDCPGGETCVATNSVCSGLSKGACTGTTKGYTVYVGPGFFSETLAKVCVGGANDGKLCPAATCTGGTCTDTSIPSPGNVDLNLTPLTQISSASECTVDWTDRSICHINGQGFPPNGGGTISNLRTDGSALCSTGGAVGNGVNNASLVHTGATGFDWHFSGQGNRTNGCSGCLLGGVLSVASGNSVYQEFYPTTCSGDATRACASNADCAGGQTCSGVSSADFAIANSFVQTGPAPGVAIDIVGKGCGTSFNMFLENVSLIQGEYSETMGESIGLRVREADCNAATTDALEHQTGITVRDMTIDGSSGAGTFTVPDLALDVGVNTKLRVAGAFTYDACARKISGTLEYADSSSTQLHGGGKADLDVLHCDSPRTRAIPPVGWPSLAGTTLGVTMSLTGGTLAAGTYCYKVVGYNATGVGDYSAGNCATCASGSTCSATLDWEPTPGVSTGYKVYGRPATAEGTYTKRIATVTSGATTYVDTGTSEADPAPTPTANSSWTANPQDAETWTSLTTTPPRRRTQQSGATWEWPKLVLDPAASVAGRFSLLDAAGTERAKIEDRTDFGGISLFTGLRSIVRFSGSTATFLDCTNSTGLCVVPGDPTANLGIATKQYADALKPSQETQSCALTSGTCSAVISTSNVTLLTLATWDNTGRTSTITATGNVKGVGASRTFTCIVYEDATPRAQQIIDTGNGSVEAFAMSLNETDSGTQGVYTLTCKASGGTQNEASAATLRRMSYVTTSGSTASAPGISVKESNGTAATNQTTLDFGVGFDKAADGSAETDISFDPTEITAWDMSGATLTLPTTAPSTNAGQLAVDNTNDKLLVGDSGGQMSIAMSEPNLNFMHLPSGDSTQVPPGTALTPVANSMRCQRFVPTYTLRNIDTIDFLVTTLGSTACGVAIYNDGAAGSRLATTGAVANTSAGIKTTSVSAFTLTEGTTYQVCWTCGDTTARVWGTSTYGTGTTGTFAFVNAGVATVGTAANAASAGAPATTTGAISTSAAASGIAWVKVRNE